MNKNIIIGIIIILIIGVLIVFVAKANDKENSEVISESTDNTSNAEGMEDDEKEQNSIYSTGTHHAIIKVKNYGEIELELYADVAPITVTNFAKLVNEGFYNGLTFHRIIDGFMIQGGDPLGNGTGGSDETIKGEFSANGVENSISHVRGVISMARSSSYNSASSQFFIVHEDSTYLDGQYASFGIVTKGMEVVDAICENTEVEDSNGTVLSENQPIIESITMVD